MSTISSFVKRHRIRVEHCELVDRNPNAEDWWEEDWWEANHYKVRLRRGDRRFTLYFSQGYGIQGEPDVVGILECLHSDAWGIDQPLEDWAKDLGFDPDSWKMERTYRTVQKQTQKLYRFLNGLYEEFLNCTQD